MDPLPVPIIGESLHRAEQARLAQIDAERRLLEARRAALVIERTVLDRSTAPPLQWGTPAAKRRVIEQLRARHELLKRGEKPPES